MNKAKINKAKSKEQQQRRIWLLSVCGGLLLVTGYWLFFSGPRVPQFQRDEEVLTTLDALFTALNSRNLNETVRLSTVMDSHYKSGAINRSGYEYVAKIIGEAKDGGWSIAAQHLYGLIDGQR